MKKNYILVALFAATTLAIAQEKAIDTVSILARNKVVKERAEFLRHSQSVETLSPYELNRGNASYLDQALATMSGVQVDRRTNLGGQRVVLRGYGNDQKFNNWGVKFYWNNMPLTNAEGVTVLDDIDVSYVNNMEIIKGPAGSLYGGGTGGVVRFYTRPEFNKGFSLSQNTIIGSFKTFQSRTELNASEANYSINATYNHLESEGYRPHGGGVKNFVNINGSVKLSEKDQLSFIASQAYSYEQMSGQVTYADYKAGIDNGNNGYISKNSGTKINSTRVGLTNWWNISKHFKNFTTVFYSNANSESISNGAFGVTGAPNYGFRTTFMMNHDFGKFSNNVEFGAELQNSVSTNTSYRFKNSDPNNPLLTTGMSGASYFKYNNNSANYFVVEKLTFKPLDLTFVAGLSVNDVNFSRKDLFALPGLLSTADHPKDQSFSKDFKTAYTPHFALQKKWGKQLIVASYSEGYNAPTASSTFIVGPNIVNDNLNPEKAQMWDLSVHGLVANTKVDYQVSIFRINYKDKLSQLSAVDTNGARYTYWENTGNQKNSGLEASIGYQHTSETSFFKKVIPFVNFSYYDSRYVNYNYNKVDYAHSKVVGVPRTKYAIGLDIHTKPGFYMMNTFTYLGDVYMNFANTEDRRIDGFGLLNSKLGYKHTVGHFDFDVFAMGNNLTSQKNYTFLFVGNNNGDGDGDINPGYKKAYFFGGLNVSYKF